MQKVIIFNGGREGAIILGEKSFRPIPPFNLAVLRKLKGILNLSQALTFSAFKDDEKRFDTLVNKVSNIVIEEIEGIIGPLDPEYSIVFQDDDGGFTCGSTGKPPIPFPWPPQKIPSIDYMISQGILEQELIDYLSKATSNNIDFKKMFESPAEVAEELQMKISTKTISDLQLLAPKNLKMMKNKGDREVMEFFYKIVEDGRFVNTWMLEPYETAMKLRVELSKDAIDRIIGGSSIKIIDSVASILIHIVVHIVVEIILERGDLDILIRDYSGLNKL